MKQDALIHEAVVVGLGKATPGLLVFRSKEAELAGPSNEEYLEAIWPTIEGANVRAERFSQISRDMIAVLPFSSKFPRTDKGSMIRAQVYAHYAELIDSIYSKAERVEGQLQFSLADTQSLLMKLCREELSISLSAEDDFFAQGVDSLKAIHLRRLILQNFRVDKAVSQNVVYQSGTIARLAEHIRALQSGQITAAVENEREVMSRLIQKYSHFHKHIPRLPLLPSSRGVVSVRRSLPFNLSH